MLCWEDAPRVKICLSLNWVPGPWPLEMGFLLFFSPLAETGGRRGGGRLPLLQQGPESGRFFTLGAGHREESGSYTHHSFLYLARARRCPVSPLSPLQSGGTSKAKVHGSGALTSVLSGSAGAWRSRKETHWLAWIWRADVAVGLGPEKCLFLPWWLFLGGLRARPGFCASTPLALPPPSASHLLWGRSFAFTPGGH